MSTNIPTDVLDKIQKLLNLAARGGTEAEAQAAFAAASKPMTKYGIERQQVELHADSKEKKTSEAVQETKLEKKWKTERPAHRSVRRVLRTCFKVEVLKIRDWDAKFGWGIRYDLIGTREDCQFAAYAFDFLNSTFQRLYYDYAREAGIKELRPKIYQAYFYGLQVGFCNAWQEAQRAQIKEQKAESYAIVLVNKDKAVDAFVGAMPNIRRVADRRSYDGAAFVAGEAKGRTLKVHVPVGAGSENSALK